VTTLCKLSGAACAASNDLPAADPSDAEPGSSFAAEHRDSFRSLPTPHRCVDSELDFYRCGRRRHVQLEGHDTVEA
jgi:hypothetical protein